MVWCTCTPRRAIACDHERKFVTDYCVVANHKRDNWLTWR
jgi:hypothetical protein